MKNKKSPQGKDVILRMSNIVKAFGGVNALDGVNLEVKRGEIHGICGENGAGKSTLMNVLSGVYPHGTFKGEIEFDGKSVDFRSINDSEDEGIAIIHQELALSPYLSIAENIFLGNERSKFGIIDWSLAQMEAAELLDRVGLREQVDTPVIQLGVGKQQLVEIAKAMAKEVKLLILDEPTAALNDEDSEHLLDLIRGLRDHGITAIIISHKLPEIRSVADNITVIRDGKTVDHFSMKDKDNSQSRMIKSMVGRSARQPVSAAHAEDRQGGIPGRELDGLPPGRHAAKGRRRRVIQRPRRRDRRHGGPDGRRSHRVVHEHLWAQLRHEDLRNRLQGRQGDLDP